MDTSSRKAFSELSGLKNNERMPVVFVGHGSPMNAIEDNAYNRTWRNLGIALHVPKAILSVSAHWITNGITKASTVAMPETIHDFGGFPQELYKIKYPAPGSPDFARQTIDMLHNSHAGEDNIRGLDHGTWSVLINMFPEADIPVYQLSIDYSKPPGYHYKIAEDLQDLRNKGVLVIGSGNIVHNLSLLKMSGEPFDWSIEFDNAIKVWLDKRDFDSVVNFQKLGNLARLAHPSYDHFLPLLYVLGLAGKSEEIAYFNEGFDLGSISMRSMVMY